MKAVRGIDAGFREALESHAKLDGTFELLCGVRDPNDPAVEAIRNSPRGRAVVCSTVTLNQKVGVLIDLTREAAHGVLIVNDADIRVPADYLKQVTGPLEDPEIGLVTCLYRARGVTLAGRFEALGVATDFAPSTLVARLVGVKEFALGSTLAFRRVDLERIGGFEAFADFLADDYQLGHRLHLLGLKCVLSPAIVETSLGGTWGGVWRHQLRWARTIRVSKLWGYVGLPITYATAWAVVAAAVGRWDIAAGLVAVRMATALAGIAVLRDWRSLLFAWAVIPRDLCGVAIWIAGLFGDTVVWRGRVLRLNREGRIIVQKS
jgi:ceramide glucosyltransferase